MSEQRNMAMSPRSAVASPDGRGHRASDCGDEITFSVKLSGWDVDDVAVQAYGCGTVLACTQAVTHLVKGKTVGEAHRAVTPHNVSQLLGGLPDEKLHAAELVCAAMVEALRQCIASARDPWRKKYIK